MLYLWSDRPSRHLQRRLRGAPFCSLSTSPAALVGRRRCHWLGDGGSGAAQPTPLVLPFLLFSSLPSSPTFPGLTPFLHRVPKCQTSNRSAGVLIWPSEGGIRWLVSLPCMHVCAGAWARAFAAGTVFVRLAPATVSSVRGLPSSPCSSSALAARCVAHSLGRADHVVLAGPPVRYACSLGLTVGASSSTSSEAGSSSPCHGIASPSIGPDLARLGALWSLPATSVLDGGARR
jgi:hypothetical protein